MKVDNVINFQTIEEQSVGEIPTSEASDNTTAITAELWLFPIGVLVLTWIVMLVKQSLTCKILRAKIANKKLLQPIPCSNCRFFNNSPYLQCAVHPSRALRAEAAECPDFWSRSSNKFSR